MERNDPDDAHALLRAAKDLAGQAPPDLHRRTARADDRGGARAVSHTVRSGCALWSADLGAVRTDMGRRANCRSRRGRNRVRMAGRPAWQPATNQVGRLRPDGADPPRTRSCTRTAQARGQVLRADRLRFRNPNRQAPAAAQRRAGSQGRAGARTDEAGRPTFPILHEVHPDGRSVPVPRGVLPSMLSFRQTVASRALLAGESVDEVAFLLGHRDGTVTRTVYVREVADARRRAFRRSRMAAEYAGALRVALDGEHGSV